MERNIFSDISDIFAKPDESPILYFFASFFIVTPLLGLAVNGLSTIVFESTCEWLKTQFGFDKLFWQITLVLLFTVLVFVLLLLFKIPQLIKTLRDRIFGQPEINVTPLQATYRGLITLASPTPRVPNRPTPTELAIRHHAQNETLEHCWIICTRSSLPEAERIIDQLVGDERLVPRKAFHYGPDYRIENSANRRQPFCLLVEDDRADDPNYIRELVNAIYQDAKANYQFSEFQIITDYTGATKSMTAGIILACANPDRKLQYISQLDNKMKEIKISYRLKPIRQIPGGTDALVSNSMPY
ncbi:MAG: CRISPR-associated protein [Leptolyngbyaceae cyanobacterium RU_5_1]|nr:CRISPR-associated protein [Leptolyngbyaceae cyanobacterium RU_5_1]